MRPLGEMIRVVIPGAGHEMFKKNPTESIPAVRACLAAPIKQSILREVTKETER